MSAEMFKWDVEGESREELRERIRQEVRRTFRQMLKMSIEDERPLEYGVIIQEIDSLDKGEILMNFELFFGIDIPQEDAGRLHSDDTYTDYILAHRPAKTS